MPRPLDDASSMILGSFAGAFERLIRGSRAFLSVVLSGFVEAPPYALAGGFPIQKNSCPVILSCFAHIEANSKHYNETGIEVIGRTSRNGGNSSNIPNFAHAHQFLAR